MNRFAVYAAARDVLSPPIASAVIEHWRVEWSGVRLYVPACGAATYSRRTSPLTGTMRWLIGTEFAILGAGGDIAEVELLLRHIGGEFIAF